MANVEACKKKRYRRRCKKNEQNNMETIKISHLNTSGYTSKQRSNTKNNFSYCKNKDRNMGGIATLVANSHKQNNTKVGKGSKYDEYHIVRLDHIILPNNFINWFREQESRNTNEDIFHGGCSLGKEDQGEATILHSDMNIAVGDDKWGVNGNKTNISYGGKLGRSRS